MVRPQWILALLLAFAVAGGFAWLGKWQLEHAITAESADSETEAPRPLTELTAPGEAITDEAAGMVASLTGQFVAGDFRVVEQRENDGVLGSWVTGHFAVTGGDEEDEGSAAASAPAALAVAIGWAPNPAEAERSLRNLQTGALAGQEIELEGRYMPADGPVIPEPSEDPMRIGSMAPAQLINVWAPFNGKSYSGYLVAHPVPEIQDAIEDAGLDVIDSVPPLPVDTINWLNLFYAAEWVVFAGFAVYFWYRLTRDAWEKEHELKLMPSDGQ